jgi:hypothetical protein
LNKVPFKIFDEEIYWIFQGIIYFHLKGDLNAAIAETEKI